MILRFVEILVNYLYSFLVFVKVVLLSGNVCWLIWISEFFFFKDFLSAIFGDFMVVVLDRKWMFFGFVVWSGRVSVFGRIRMRDFFRF